MDHKTVRELFEYRDGEMYWRKRPFRSHCDISQPAGSIDNKGYISIGFRNKRYLGHRLIFLYHHGFLPEFLDHIDNNSLNNNINNLRPANPSENKRNSKINKSNTSGYKGVHFDKRKNKWRSRIWVNGRNLNLGSFKTPSEAHQSYCQAADKYHGEFANYGY